VHNGRYVIMGVSGSGKTTIGEQLARALGVEFLEGDALHSSANVERMAAGIPLTDEDRRPWLVAIAQRLRDAAHAGAGLVVACSALKRSYRDLLRASGDADLQLIHLVGTRSRIADRMQRRTGHYMPSSLLESQLSTLEPPLPDEHPWVYDVRQAPPAIIADILKRIG
jgi:carbohydrate kinase (thermoresistant glucokinase family)